MQEQVVDESRGPYFPFNRRETYPKRLKVDFRRLPTSTLLTYTAHHDLHVRPDSTHEELAIATARHFAAWRINEESIMRSFCQGLASSTIGTPTRTLGDAENNKRKRLDSLDRDLNIVPPSPELLGLANAAAASVGRGSRRDPHHKSSSNPRSPPRSRSRGGAANSNGGGGARDRASDRRGDDGGLGLLAQGAASSSSLFTHRPVVFDTAEQVAAYVSGAWILARVVQHKGYGKVELHDEDDASHVFELPISQVRHLEDLSSDLGKHDKVLAVFPDTTIFYCATVAKDSPRMDGNTKVLVVYFEDDEDANGGHQYRRIPVEHVMIEDDGGHANRHGYAAGAGVGGRSNGGGTGRSERSARSSVSGRATGSYRSRSTSPRVRNEYGGGSAAGSHLMGGAASLASRASGGSSAVGGGGGRASNGNRDQQGGSKKGGATYADMIAHALGKVENGKGAFTQICNIIERQFSEYLNWKLESDVRKTPVWKSSVRKILFSNSRFQHHSTTPELGHVFTMARSKKNN
ncbi:conserved unknown protein [Ectocarpus siliculosus]|uniref:SGF29 C-terminal domain-containing protein n=1 Tax=Ectocarpus siliculosus TaxID=2880 RepID=D7FY84_ECTSI|nr:conserved unknown protein [Ectocarpus siliculosus]|eukprot:CBJ26523.1 conserved unknown protein [Ectocarpus siliculosus]